MRKAILSLLLATFLCAVVLPQFANADEWDKKTIVTFSQDVAIPGQVLPLALTFSSCFVPARIVLWFKSGLLTKNNSWPV